MTTQGEEVAAYFDQKAVRFDKLYGEQKTSFGRWLDTTFRRDIYLRYVLTFACLGDIEGASVLDVGCGPGWYAVEAARRRARSVVGIDEAPEMLTIARQRAAEAGATACEFVEGRFPNDELHGPFDAGIVMGVMDYISEPVPFVKAVRSLTEGTVCYSFPSRHWFRTPLREVRYRMKSCPLFFYDVDAVLSLFRSSNGGRITDLIEIPGPGMDIFVAVDTRGDA